MKEQTYPIIRITEQPALIHPAAAWFHSKFSVPEEAYRESMQESVKSTSAVPQWYLVLDADAIIAACGVIENDFHERKDLAPNVCAVYVEGAYRGQGIAGRLLHFVAEDMHAKGIDTLYLLTDHTGFYERYGWEYIGPVRGDGEKETSRMYRHQISMITEGT